MMNWTIDGQLLSFAIITRRGARLYVHLLQKRFITIATKATENISTGRVKESTDIETKHMIVKGVRKRGKGRRDGKGPGQNEGGEIRQNDTDSELSERDSERRRCKEMKEEADEPEVETHQDQQTVFAYQLSLKADERHVYEFICKAGKDAHSQAPLMRRLDHLGTTTSWSDTTDFLLIPLRPLAQTPISAVPEMLGSADRHHFLISNSSTFVYLRFENTESAMSARRALHRRWFAGKMVTAAYMDGVTMTIPSGATTGEPLSHAKYTRSKVIKCYIIAVIAGFAYGYSQTFVGGLLNMPNFVVMLLGKKGYRKAEKAVVSNFCSYVNRYMLLCSASVPFGTTIGLIVGKYLHISWGPKGRMGIGAAWLLAASLSALAFPHGLALPVFFLVIGVSIGIIIEAVPLLYKQITREDVHLRIGNVFNLAYYLGIVSALLVNYLISRHWPNGWRVTFFSLAFPAFVLIAASLLFLKRTRVNDPEESCMVLLRQHKGVFFHKTFFLLLAQFMGSSQLVFYGPMILESLNFGSYQQFLTPLLGSSIGSFVVAVVMLLIVPRNLRRPTFLISCFLICISQLCMWVLFHFWGSRQHHFKSSIVSTIGGILLILIYGSYFVIDGPYGWTRKEYPKVVQGVGNTLETAVMRFVIGLINLLVPFFICALKKWAFLYFAVLGFGYCLIAYMFVHDH